MKRTVVLCVLVAAAAPAAAFAHVVDGKTSLVLRGAPARSVEAGSQVVVSGRLTSPLATCRSKRVVLLYRLVGGSARLAMTGRTSLQGNFGLRLTPKVDQRVFVRFAGFNQSSYGHFHRCAPSRSKTLTLEVQRA